VVLKRNLFLFPIESVYTRQSYRLVTNWMKLPPSCSIDWGNVISDIMCSWTCSYFIAYNSKKLMSTTKQGFV
jgi:hypothetical protein